VFTFLERSIITTESEGDLPCPEKSFSTCLPRAATQARGGAPASKGDQRKAPAGRRRGGQSRTRVDAAKGIKGNPHDTGILERVGLQLDDSAITVQRPNSCLFKRDARERQDKTQTDGARDRELQCDSPRLEKAGEKRISGFSRHPPNHRSIPDQIGTDRTGADQARCDGAQRNSHVSPNRGGAVEAHLTCPCRRLGREMLSVGLHPSPSRLWGLITGTQVAIASRGTVTPTLKEKAPVGCEVTQGPSG
jgi:hypothetical protein